MPLSVSVGSVSPIYLTARSAAKRLPPLSDIKENSQRKFDINEKKSDTQDRILPNAGCAFFFLGYCFKHRKAF